MILRGTSMPLTAAPALLLASAEVAANADSIVMLLLESLALIAVIAVAAVIPIALARLRRHRQSDAVRIVALLWAVACAGYCLYTLVRRFRWTREHAVLLTSGYYDAEAPATAAPSVHWPLMALLAGVYVALFLVAVSQDNRGPSSTPPLPENPPSASDPRATANGRPHRP